jgi:penicillin-binding protein 2
MNAESMFAFRLQVISIGVAIVFVILFMRLWYIQVFQSDYYVGLAEGNRIRVIRVKAPRGLFIDTKGEVLVKNRPSFNVFIIPEDAKDLAYTARQLTELLPLTEKEIITKVKKSQRPKFEPVLIQRDIPLAKVAYLEEHKMSLPGVTVEVEPLRYNIHGDFASHVLGYLGEINEEQLKNKAAYPTQRLGDLIGQYGLERGMETDLMGENGGKQVEVNASGRELRIISQKEQKPGHNIVLTIDLEIQKLAQEAFKDKTGAVVVMDPKTGHILALVSNPSFDPNLFAGGISQADWKSLTDNPYHPLQNRAVQATYAPGSTFKMITASTGLEKGIINRNSTLFCGGSVAIGNTVKRCWKFGGHGNVSVIDAIKQSCNGYFYRLSEKISMSDLAKFATSYGLGGKTGIDLPNEEAGLIPTEKWKQETYHERWYPSETADAAIGQGFVSVTPLQLISMVSAIANGGILYKPMLVKEIRDSDDTVVETFKSKVMKKVPIKEENLKIIRRGMWAVVNEDHGTGSKARIEGLDIAGKTGTAQVIKLKSKIKPKMLPEKYRDHAWFVSFAPVDDPKIAMVVFVEHGLKGGDAAAPVAKVIYDGIFNKDNQLTKKIQTEQSKQLTMNNGQSYQQ